MISPNPFQAEIDYRRNRIRNEVAVPRRTRIPFVRRPAESRRATS
jgi:hypothetical protein